MSAADPIIAQLPLRLAVTDQRTLALSGSSDETNARLTERCLPRVHFCRHIRATQRGSDPCHAGGARAAGVAPSRCAANVEPRAAPSGGPGGLQLVGLSPARARFGDPADDEGCEESPCLFDERGVRLRDFGRRSATSIISVITGATRSRSRSSWRLVPRPGTKLASPAPALGRLRTSAASLATRSSSRPRL